jgi:hypothetical protein
MYHYSGTQVVPIGGVVARDTPLLSTCICHYYPLAPSSFLLWCSLFVLHVLMTYPNINKIENVDGLSPFEAGQRGRRCGPTD